MQAPSHIDAQTRVRTARAEVDRGSRPTRWRMAVAGLFLLAALAAFFATPLTKYATHSYCAADLTQDYPLTRVEQSRAPANRLLSDPVTEMLPWLLLNRAELEEGRIPLWDDRNGTGVPHLANYQSAVFSPFSLPFYTLSLKAALLLSAFLKLAAIALFTYLFLDLLGLGTLACVIGTLAYTFSGHNVLLLPYPHPAAGIVLPAGLYFAELALSRAEQGRRILWACIGLALSFGIGVYCGHPEPFYFGVLFVALWTAVRLIGQGWREWLDRGSIPRTFALAARILAAAVAGLALGAPQILPFLEYMRHSTMFVVRSGDQSPLDPVTWPLYAFPDLLGNPSRAYNLTYQMPPPNYESANTCYIGSVAMALALVAVVFLRSVRAARFFVPAAVLWFLYAYDVGGFSKWVALIPTVGIAPINRSQPIELFTLAACAAIAVHGLERVALAARWAWALATLLICGGAMWYATDFAWDLFSRVRVSGYARLMPKGSDLYAIAHMQFIVGTFAVGLLALIALWFLRGSPVRRIPQILLIVVVFLQSGWVMRDYNPTIEDRFVYPVTPAIERLQRFGKDEPILILGQETLPPHTNAVYGIRSLSTYDAMGIRKYDELYRESFGLGGGNWRLALQTSAKWMRQFAVRLVLSPGPWIKVDSLADEVLISPRDLHPTGEILPGQSVQQTLLGERERLQGIALQFNVPRPTQCTVEAVLIDAITGLEVGRQTWRTDEWRNDRFGRHEELFGFPSMVDARLRPLKLIVSSPDATAGNAVSLWSRDDYWYWNQYLMHQRPLRDVVWTLEPTKLHRPGSRPHGTLHQGERRLGGGLLMDQAYDLDQWQLLKPIAGFTFGVLNDAPARYTTVSRAIAPSAVGEDFMLLHYGNVDPLRAVVLSHPGRPVIDTALGRGGAPEPPVSVLSETSDRVLLRVERETAGYVVLRRAMYPGWHARVNGVEAVLLRADHAFCAVEVPAGVSEIEYFYAPASFRLGLWIAVGVPALLAFFAFALRGYASPRPAA